jgi:hypothetical protein
MEQITVCLYVLEWYLGREAGVEEGEQYENKWRPVFICTSGLTYLDHCESICILNTPFVMPGIKI